MVALLTALRQKQLPVRFDMSEFLDMVSAAVTPTLQNSASK